MSGTWVHWFFAINEHREEIEEELKKRLKKRSDKIPGEEIREEIEVFQNGQIATLEMMEVPDSQNGNMVRKIDHID